MRPHVGRIVRGGRDDATHLVGVVLRLTVTCPALVTIDVDLGVRFINSTTIDAKRTDTNTP